MAYALTEVSTREKLAADGKFEATRVFDCTPWNARGEAYADLAGGVRLVGRRLVRTLPARHPAFPWLFVSEITTDPVDQDDYLTHAPTANVIRVGAPYSGPARLTVVYRPPEYDEQDADQSKDPQEQQEIEIASFSWDFSARNLTLPNQYMVWARDQGTSDARSLFNTNVAAVKTIPQIEMQLVRHLCLRKPHAAILANLGRVNKSAFRIGFDRYPPQTVRLDSAHASQKLTTLGLKYWDITYKFAVMPVWDKVEILPTPDAAPRIEDNWVTWNRLFDPVGIADDPGAPGTKTPCWRKAVFSNDGTRGLYLLDEDAPTQRINGRTVKGFNLLFNPGAR